MEEMLVQSGADLDCDVMTMGHMAAPPPPARNIWMR